MAQVKDQVAQMAVQGCGIGLVLPQHRQHFTVGAGGTVAVHQIGQQLFALAALEGQCAPIDKDLKIAEALDLDACRAILRRVAQMLQHVLDIILVCGLEQKAADEDLQRFQRIFRMLCHHNDVTARLQLLDHARQTKPVHAGHFQIQEGSIHRPLTHPCQSVFGGHGADIITVGCNTAQDADQRVDRKLSVIDDQYLHLITHPRKLTIKTIPLIQFNTSPTDSQVIFAQKTETLS